MTFDTSLGMPNPDNPSPATSDQLYAKIGRVLAAASLVELWVTRVLQTCDGLYDPKHPYEGMQYTNLIGKLAEKLDGQPEHIQEEGRPLITRVESAFAVRNEIAHSYWPKPWGLPSYRQRLLPKGKRSIPAEWLDDRVMTAADFDKAIADLKDVFESLMNLQCHVEQENQRADSQKRAALAEQS